MRFSICLASSGVSCWNEWIWMRSSRSYSAYEVSTPRLACLSLHLNRLLSFSLASLGFARFDSHLLATVFAGPPTNCKADDLDVALAWLRQARLHLPASWAIAAARQDPRVANRAQQVTHKDRLASLFEMRYRERFGHGLA